jgi:hypothetical protein
MLHNLYREDLFYSDKDMDTFTTTLDGPGRKGSKWEKDKHGPTQQGFKEYELFSERF